MSKIHILGPTFSTFLKSVRLYCEELNLEYTYGPELNGKEIALRSDALEQLHPFKKVPVLIYEGIPIFETAAICRFLDNISPTKKLIPKDPLTIALIDEWTSSIGIYIDNILIRQFFLEFAFPKGPDNTVREDVIQKITPEVISALNLLDKQIGNNPFFCGDFYSMADAFLTPILDYVSKTPNHTELFDDTQNLIPYLTRMKERPSGKAVFSE